MWDNAEYTLAERLSFSTIQSLTALANVLQSVFKSALSCRSAALSALAAYDTGLNAYPFEEDESMPDL